ncbi:phosphatidylserine decarboxylase proenzyme [Alteromonas sp. KC3]|uniref:archaetidylserine decarboxylase n=1 Tax=unclassified Alteromonas TaxID=2614992 RepID=UPI0019210373|nr:MULTISPECIES: archaetidylserine decarboxylase [unclassified Alteromonas]BCO17548.1 phosphatidylserine decarboxylase proenzyme [Alteromonas sp. KC3]BCO21526.1 phosphatidylserine decarboxylase proenzyme [Alteromonas sp. KC14]
MLDWLKVNLQYVTPKHLLSRLVGKLAEAEMGSVTTFFIKTFIKQYNVDMTEALYEDPTHYRSFNAFFTRPLKPDARSIDDNDNVLIHAVDGTVSQFGDINSDSIFQAKGHDFSLTTLLGGKPEIAAPFKNGKFATIYLAPRDYHRIHMPIEGTLTDMIYVPGELFSVNPLTAQNIPGLFARNERVVALFDTPVGKMAMVLVGATIVASIETVWSGTVTPPAGKNVQHWSYEKDSEAAVKLEKGAELGRFKLGSTIVVCFEKDMIEFEDMAPGMVTRLGVPMANMRNGSDDTEADALSKEDSAEDANS